MIPGLFRPTPVLTSHAKERCAEMGISTKVAKAIVRHPALTRPDRPDTGHLIVVSDRHPEYAVVYEPGRPDVIVTVLFNARDFTQRAGCTYLKEEAHG